MIKNFTEEELALGCNNLQIFKAINKTKRIIKTYSDIAVSVSGGSDSDIIMDIMERSDYKKNISYIFFDTGLEYKATFDQLDMLEKKYDVKIIRIKATQPIPITTRLKGEPFLSKYVSEMMQRLQKHNFTWEDDTFENLYKKYPKCKSALNWWTNNNGEKSSFNITRNKLLKEYILLNHPDFKISNKCCDYAKKKPSKKFIKNNVVDLMIIGIRKSEGGIRAQAYKTCYYQKAEKNNEVDTFLPILWFTDSDKKEYEKHFNVIHSNCYTEYGLKRTGCAGCPYGRKFEEELNILEKYEPNLFIGVNNIFKNSYKYTRGYNEFKKKNKKKKK